MKENILFKFKEETFVLNFKDLIYVKKLILSGKLLISKKDRKALTEEDVSKLSFINETSADKKIYWRLIKNVSLDEIKKLFIYLTFDLHELNIFLNNGYDIEKFIEEILMVYKDNYSEYIIKMIKLNYTIEQIKFLLENKMLYNTYHCHFDYYEIFDEYTNLGFDPSKKSVISCSHFFS